MYSACTVLVQCLYSACTVLVQCIFKMLYDVNRLLCTTTTTNLPTTMIPTTTESPVSNCLSLSSLTNNNSGSNFNGRITIATSAAAASPTTATMTSTTTATTIINHPPKIIVPAIKKLPPLYCRATDGGTHKLHAQIVDEIFLQQWLEFISGGGGPSPKTIAIKWDMGDQ